MARIVRAVRFFRRLRGAVGVLLGVAAAGFVADDGETLAEGFGEFG
jgi:hypothetical protein